MAGWQAQGKGASIPPGDASTRDEGWHLVTGTLAIIFLAGAALLFYGAPDQHRQAIQCQAEGGWRSCVDLSPDMRTIGFYLLIIAGSFALSTVAPAAAWRRVLAIMGAGLVAAPVGGFLLIGFAGPMT